MAEMLGTMKIIAEALASNVSSPISYKSNKRSEVNNITVEPSSASSESEHGESSVHGDSDSTSERSRSRSKRKRPRSRTSGLKLPSFDGNESWKIWKNRFIEMAERRKWSEETKLDVLLQRMQGTAGEFVFGELSQSVRRKFHRLIKELDSRFLIVETKRSYAAKFNNRNQKVDETIEQYAAELKRLYSKAYPGRDTVTRNEDLVRKFLDGLQDDDAQFQVEFGKSPNTIDEAVSEVVNFMETRRGRRDRKLRSFNVSSGSDTDRESDEAEGKQKLPCKKKKWGRDRRKISSLEGKLQKLTGQIEKFEEQNKLKDNKSNLSMNKSSLPNAAVVGSTAALFTMPPPPIPAPGAKGFAPAFRGVCYNCHHQGHIARECPLRQNLSTNTMQSGTLNTKGHHP